MERFTEDLARLDHFILRALRFQAMALAFLMLGLLPGIVGFYMLEGLGWHEATLNALSMLGSVSLAHPPSSLAGKYFAALYGLFLDSVFLVALGVVVTPFAHRLLHRWNLAND
ncbi:hypothetical protein A7D27_05380 [Pseudomonas sp. 1D4]|uniref:hypothetical protein n=1 Tax=Pseudomonadaceae TaxID=135621 RepID=UPI00084B19F1|nr:MULTISPECIES: hypothetical protein [Pseudomonas]OEC45226.1 hypothetical protein A7D27_05380 [Pseudomonas sp. 1D4]OEC61676.1 hypothetical protein A9G05_01395 [Pseudomonas sp. ENNP23]